ncbi:MAG: pH-response regulator protein palH/rim21 [Watsoniomyces obsoletus]|nr:MAG: pH-response regulator protein palH/rim21 [Watsoniomyces obsoletus]
MPDSLPFPLDEDKLRRAQYLREPFYASTLPQTYALAGCTVLAYNLFIMLIITPRTFYIAGAGRSGGFLGGHGLLAGASGNNPVIGVGRRPWLQKVAALTVAVSLTMASAHLVRDARKQYRKGHYDIMHLRKDLTGPLEMRIVRFISDTFLWLAQAQTLIRLFPRQREKKIIRWTACILILMDTVFSALNQFVFLGRPRPRSSANAVSVLRYLFQLTLSVLYAASVVYYSFSKRQIAFYHRKMRNVSLVAVLSLASVLVPIVFFVADVSKPRVAGWGDYIRWVGAAAASVVVWEWVERIEAIEREDIQEGILGREVFDGDNTSDSAPSARLGWPLHQGSGSTGSPPSSEDEPAMNGFGKVTASMSSFFSAKKAAMGSRGTDSRHEPALPVTVIPAPVRFASSGLQMRQQERASSVVISSVEPPIESVVAKRASAEE